MLINIGIGLINEKKQAEAITWFTRTITAFPKDASAYYYRGISQLSLGNTAEAKADLQKFVSLAPADAPELDTARKILDTIKISAQAECAVRSGQCAVHLGATCRAA